ncbi:MAG: dihydrodipicolinate synthase family protein [Clostridiales bacterium]|nr:dihydrodipicolinate synthase family protein [Clostridiales bacterium]
MKELFYVDRIESGIAVLSDDAGDNVTVSIGLLPAGTREGCVLVRENGLWRLDGFVARKIKTELLNRQSRLLNKGAVSMIKNIPDGQYPTMLTTYNDDGSVDFDALGRLLGWYSDRGVTGLFAICQSSEIFFLSFEERLAILRYVMEHKPAGMPIVASGNVEDDLDRQIEEARAFISTGIDAYVFISNRLAKEDDSDDVLLSNLKYVTDRLPDTAFGFYECPHPYKRVLSPYVIKHIASWGNFKFIKDTCSDLGLIKEKLDAAQGTGLKIFNANCATLLDSMKLGCAGFSGIMSNFMPELFTELLRVWKTDDERARMIQDYVGFASLAEGCHYNVNAKYYINLTGTPVGLTSRSTDKNKFPSADRVITEEMFRSTERFKKLLFQS